MSTDYGSFEASQGSEPRSWAGAAGVFEEEPETRRWPRLVVGGTGAALGLAVAGYLRSRARRRSRVDQMRAQVRKATAGLKRASDTAPLRQAASNRAAALQATLPENLDRRAGAGSLALFGCLALFAAIRRRQREVEVRRLARLRQLALREASRKRRLFGVKLVRDRLPLGSRWAAGGAGFLLLAAAAAAARRATSQEEPFGMSGSEAAVP